MQLFVKQGGGFSLEHGLEGANTCSATVTPEASWNHAAVVYRSASQSSSLYLNGQLQSASCSSFNAPAGQLYYGGGGGALTWLGALQEGKVYSKAMQATDLPPGL